MKRNYFSGYNSVNRFFKYFLMVLSAVILSGSAKIDEKVPAGQFRFDFGSGKTASGYTRIEADAVFSEEAGFGFEPGIAVQDVDRGGDALTGDFVTSGSLIRFSVVVPEGNYKVTLVLGDADGNSLTTVKSETRRLMLESIATTAGKFEKRTFMVNMRTNEMSPGNEIKLDSREWNPLTKEILSATWDNKLTLQFSGEHICLCAIEIERDESAVTVFLIGDSTVTDQQGDGTGSWGQNLPRWFGLPVVIANHAESGQTLKAFRFQHRWEKLMDLIKPGDYVFMQFGHNDSKKEGHDPMWPDDDKAGNWAVTHSEANTDYKWGLAINAVEIKRRGGIPVIVSPITRINKATGEVNSSSLGDYPGAAREAAELAGCAFIDLFTMSVETINSLGTSDSPAAYADGTHTSSYGGYLYSRCVVEGIRKAGLDLARYLVNDAGTFDTAYPEPLPDNFKIFYDHQGTQSR